MDRGEIYLITSPSGKCYVGQCVKYLSNGKQWGYMKRWNQHVRDACNGKDYCRLLNNAIRKYGQKCMMIRVLEECNVSELDFKENHYIRKLNTLTPNGYNLTTGKSTSRQSDETKQKRRESMLGKNMGKVYPKRERLREEDKSLPKYLRYYKDISGKEGYRISHHPMLHDKSFVSKKLTLQQKLELALNYMQIQD